MPDPAALEAVLDPEMLGQIDVLEAFQPGAKRQLVDLFLSSVATHHATAERAVGSGESETLRVAAHSIKGVAASLGARRLAELASQLETSARAGALDAAPALLGAIGREFEAAGTQLRRWVG